MRHSVSLESATFLKKPLFHFISAIGCDVFRATNAMDWMLGILWILIIPSVGNFMDSDPSLCTILCSVLIFECSALFAYKKRIKM